MLFLFQTKVDSKSKQNFFDGFYWENRFVSYLLEPQLQNRVSSSLMNLMLLHQLGFYFSNFVIFNEVKNENDNFVVLQLTEDMTIPELPIVLSINY
jgi:hypothetical protein